MKKKNGVVDKNNIIQKRAAKAARETRDMFKALFVSVMALLGIMAVSYYERLGHEIQFELYISKTMYVIFAVLGVITLAFAAYFIICRKNKKDESQRVITSRMMFMTSFSAFILSGTYLNSVLIELTSSERMLMIIAAAVLFFIFKIFGLEFFAVSAQSAIGLFAIKLLGKGAGVKLPEFIMTATLVLAIFGAYLMLALATKTKALKITKYASFYITAAVVLAGVLLAYFIPAISGYSMFAVFTLYLVNAVISTIKLI